MEFLCKNADPPFPLLSKRDRRLNLTTLAQLQPRLQGVADCDSGEVVETQDSPRGDSHEADDVVERYGQSPIPFRGLFREYRDDSI